MSARTTYLTASYSAGLLVVGLTILLTSIATVEMVGPCVVTGAVVTTAGSAASAVTGTRAAREYAAEQVAQADSAALARAVIQHDAKLAAAPPERSVVAFQRRTTRETP
ncbi:hypothetical protein [Streptomyces sp. ML-6]|uniref:hypothetical protein n=1 Tax=Streptomyces sp. ML-6 TaxID=2982693 RepID=UPI0024BF89AA|nr:hypothetical protein [Streptomyces sp. ML-6]MDK0520345.1 hypothetical protein [Streptomyces sp. ML-6]